MAKICIPGRDPNHGTNRTTNLMRYAPDMAVFVWCNDHITYPQELALSMDRPDIKVVPLLALERGCLLGLDRFVTIDHAANLSADLLEQVYLHNLRVAKEKASA